jgi:hypothetical protein
MYEVHTLNIYFFRQGFGTRRVPNPCLFQKYPIGIILALHYLRYEFSAALNPIKKRRKKHLFRQSRGTASAWAHLLFEKPMREMPAGSIERFPAAELLYDGVSGVKVQQKKGGLPSSNSPKSPAA